MEEVKTAVTVILPYVKHILEGIRRIAAPLNIWTCLNQIVRNLLVYAKEQVPSSMMKGIVNYI